MTGRLLWEISFNASYTSPEVKAPSPITAMVLLLSPDKSFPRAIPAAIDKEVELCPA